MSQSDVSAAPRSNRTSGSKHIESAPSVAARLRSNKHPNETVQKRVKEPSPHANRQVEQLKTPANEPQATEYAHARMTRQRTSNTSPREDTITGEDFESPSQSISSVEAIAQICLCQPDPKIPRPRNAFILYRQHNQQNLILQNKRLSNPEISKIAGQLWKQEPEEVKACWKKLAEDEKERHALQYPDYRFQPRHKSKASPTVGPGERTRCQKCGGQSIVGPSSAFQTPLPSASPKTTFSTTESVPRTPNFSQQAEKGTHHSVGMLNTSGHPHHGSTRYLPASTPLTRKYPETAIELSDPKRRRQDNYSPAAPSSTRVHFPRRIMTGSQTPTSAHPPYPPPRMADPRRGSISGMQHSPYYDTRGSSGHVLASPPPATPRGSVGTMEPPPTRASGAGRSSLHNYPVTPSTGQHHGLPYSASPRPRGNSESLRLAPLLSPGAGDHSRSIGAMIMTIPVIGKLAQLRRIAPPIKTPALDSPGFRIRGSILALDGDNRSGVEEMLTRLEPHLRRIDDFDIRVLAGPPEPKEGVMLKDYLDMVIEWHDKTKEMVEFVTGVGHRNADEETGSEVSPGTVVSAIKEAVSEELDVEEGEVVEASERSAGGSVEEQEQELEKKKEKMTAAVEREARRQSAEAVRSSSKVPLLLVSNYILSGSNAWSTMLPINDVYSPADHWAWTATLWRGIVGADLTVYVRNIERDREELLSAGAIVEPPDNKKHVEMKDDVGAILVNRENEQIEDAAIRRVAFEIGEYVRLLAAKHA